MTDKEKIRADVDAAMQDVEEKSKAFTEAHKGESAEEILAGMKGIDPSIQDIVDKHWFEMLGEEPVSEGLEEEIKRNVYDPFFDLNGVAIKGATGYLTVEDVADIARHFANWQKQQMMKDAVDAKVIARWPLHSAPLYCSYEMYIPYAQHLSEGDKVKLIIIKGND